MPRLEDCSDGFQYYEKGGATGCWSYSTVNALYRGSDASRTRAGFSTCVLQGYARGEFQGFGENGMSRDCPPEVMQGICELTGPASGNKESTGSKWSRSRRINNFPAPTLIGHLIAKPFTLPHPLTPFTGESKFLSFETKRS